MKKFLLFVFTCLSLNTFAQGDIAYVRKVNFYGVDFSYANLFGWDDSPAAIKSELGKINNLFITQSKKYNVGKYFKKDVISYCLKSTDKHNEKLSTKGLSSNTTYIELNDKQIRKIIADLSCTNDDYGLVFIAENLNKQDEKATYFVVFFNGSTKEIIYSKRASGKALGLGIRNHWAGSIYKMMKDWKY